MNDVVVLAIISNAFWLILFFVCVGIFRREIRSLLGSLSSFSVAGSHFELGSKNLTLKSYSILSEIFLNVLCNSPNLHNLAEHFSDVDIHQLTKFTTKYLLEAPKGETNSLLIRNVAYIAGRKGRLTDSLSLYTFLLERYPSDMDLRNDMGCLLISKNPTEAKKVFEALIQENPGVLLYRLNNAYANIMLDNFDYSIRELACLIKEGVWLDVPDLDIFQQPSIEKLARLKPKEYQDLVALLQGEKQLRQTEKNRLSTF